GFFCFLWVVVLFQYNTQGDLRSSQWVFVTPCYQGSASTPPGTEGNHCRQVSTPLSTTACTIRSSSSSCSGSSNTIESWINITRPIRSSSSPYPASVNMRSMILSDDSHQSLPNCARADWTRWVKDL